MNKSEGVLLFFLVVFLIIIGFGGYITAMAFKKPTDEAKLKGSNKWIHDHLKALKVVGPVTLVLGLLGLGVLGYMYTSGIHHPAHSGDHGPVSMRFY
jgi:hypothetical protein